MTKRDQFSPSSWRGRTPARAHLVEHVAHVALERDVARVLLVAQEEHDVHQRHGVVVDGGDDLAVVLLVHGIGGVEQPGGLYVLVGELANCLGVSALVTV